MNKYRVISVKESVGVWEGNFLDDEDEICFVENVSWAFWGGRNSEGFQTAFVPLIVWDNK